MSTYERRKAEKKCVNCGAPISGRYTYCDHCKDKIRALQREEYAEKRRLCMCVKCGKPTGGKAHCPDCLAIARVKERMRYRNKTDEERRELYLKNKRYLAAHPEKAELYRERRLRERRIYDAEV